VQRTSGAELTKQYQMQSSGYRLDVERASVAAWRAKHYVAGLHFKALKSYCISSSGTFWLCDGGGGAKRLELAGLLGVGR